MPRACGAAISALHSNTIAHALLGGAPTMAKGMENGAAPLKAKKNPLLRPGCAGAVRFPNRPAAGAPYFVLKPLVQDRMRVLHDVRESVRVPSVAFSVVAAQDFGEGPEEYA